MKVAHIKLQGGGSYTIPLTAINDPLNSDLADAAIGETLVFAFTLGEMTNEEYEALPEFEGH